MQKNNLIWVVLCIFYAGVCSAQTETLSAKPTKNYKVVDFATQQTEAQYIDGVSAIADFVTKNLASIIEKKNERGKIMLSITINKEGYVEDALVLMGINSEVDAAVVGILKKMPQWLPARVNGESISSDQIVTLEIIY